MLSDIWYVVRSLSRTPGVALAIVLTIGLGIGTQITIDGFVRGLIGGNTPLDEIDGVVSLFEQDAKGNAVPLSYNRYLSLKAHTDIFERLAAAREAEVAVTLRNRDSVMSGLAVTPDLARILGLALNDGVLVSDRLWKEELASRDVRAESMAVDAREAHVDGIAPQWLDGLYVGRAVDVWVPLDESSLNASDRTSRSFWVVGRLQRGVTMADARAAVNGAGHSGELIVRPYTRMTPETANAMTPIAVMLEGAGAAVFLIACGNVIAFLLSRAVSRSVETSVRVAIGATRVRIARLLVADSLVLSLVGGAAGFVLGRWTKNLIPALFYDQDAEQLLFVPDLGRLVSVAAACMGAMAACGLMPLVQLRRDVPASVLQRGNAGAVPRRVLLDRLVVAQVGFSCLLVLSAGLLLNGFRATVHTYAPAELGEPILATVRSRVFESPSQTKHAGLKYFDEVEQTALTIDSIFRAVWVGPASGSPPAWRSVVVEPPRLPTHDVALTVVPWTPALLARVRLPPIAGRMFGGADREGCPGVVINNVAAALVFDGDAVGRVIYDAAGQRLEIIGVVESLNLKGDPGPVAPTVYYESERPELPPVSEATGLFRVPVRSSTVTTLVDTTVVSPSYFSAMAVTPSAGRLFDESRASGCRVGVINDIGAERLFGGDAIGGAVIERSGRRTDIIGVVRPRFAGAWQRSTEPAIYFPMRQDVLSRMTVILGSRETDAAFLERVQRQIESVPGGDGSAVVTTLADHLSSHALAPERIATTLIGASAAIGVTLGVLGLYGAMSDAARRRRREIALRLALGAQRWRIVGHVVAAGARLAAAGAIAGLLAALVVARWITGITGSNDSVPIWMWLSTPLILAIAVVLAGVVPARRAMAIDPLVLLKEK